MAAAGCAWGWGGGGVGTGFYKSPGRAGRDQGWCDATTHLLPGPQRSDSEEVGFIVQLVRAADHHFAASEAPRVSGECLGTWPDARLQTRPSST